jgi:hypothetical protein
MLRTNGRPYCELLGRIGCPGCQHPQREHVRSNTVATSRDDKFRGEGDAGRLARHVFRGNTKPAKARPKNGQTAPPCVRAGAIPRCPLSRCNGSGPRFGSGSPHPPAAVRAKTARFQMAAGEPEAQAAPLRAAPPPTGMRQRAWDATANGSPGAPQEWTPTFPPSNGPAGAKAQRPALSA